MPKEHTAREMPELEQDPVDAIMHSIPNVGPKTREECLELGKRIKEGRKPGGNPEDAQEAVNELVYSCAGINLNLASKYAQKTGIPTEELLMQGFEGLTKAANAYDYERGNKFVTIAVTAIMWEITRKITKDKKFSLEISFADREDDAEFYNSEEDDFLEDRIEDTNALYRGSLEDEVDLSTLREILGAEFKSLTAKQAKALFLRYGDGLSFKEAGRRLGGRSSQGVKFLELRALKKMKRPEVAEKLRPFLNKS